MTTLIYNKRFAAKVKSGEKRTTIRPERKRPIKAGEMLSHREWKGVAYRSKQVVLCDAACKSTHKIVVRFPAENHEVWIDDVFIDKVDDIDAIARADGFDNAWTMLEFFEFLYGKNKTVFHGTLIAW